MATENRVSLYPRRKGSLVCAAVKPGSRRPGPTGWHRPAQPPGPLARQRLQSSQLPLRTPFSPTGWGLALIRSFLLLISSFPEPWRLPAKFHMSRAPTSSH